MHVAVAISNAATASATGLRPHSFSSSYYFRTLIPFNYWRLKSTIAASIAKKSMHDNLSPSLMSATASNSPMLSAPEPKLKPKLNPQPWLIVGLGNPGKRRHNVGFEMLDAIAEAEGISMGSVSFKALFGRGFVGDVPVMLAKPQTFMNASGESVGAIVSYYKIPLNQVLVVFDDMDLAFGKLRLLPKGGHGGHNGVRSIINHLKGSRDFPRLGIGIGQPPGKMDAVNFVMRPFNRDEHEELNFTFQAGLEAVRILLCDGIDKSATFVNGAKSLEYLGQ